MANRVKNLFERATGRFRHVRNPGSGPNHEVIPHNGSRNGNGSHDVSGFWQAFEAARWSGYRGWWYLPSLDTEAQMPRFTREQIAKKSVWSYNNIGAIHSLIDRTSLDECDTGIWPTPLTSSPAFNRAVHDRFKQEMIDPRTFDLRQTVNFYAAPFMVRNAIKLLGDLFAQLVRPATPQSGPRINFIPGYQCVSPHSTSAEQVDTDPRDYAIRDGIQFDPETHAPAKYMFARRLQNVEGTVDEADYITLDANDVLHFHDDFAADQIRGIGMLAPVVRKIFSMNDIERAETSGQTLRSRQAYAIETKGPESLGGPNIKLPGAKQTDVITNNDGSKTFIQKVVAMDGSEIDVVTPPSGAEVKVLESSRAGAIEFNNYLARDIASASPYPPEWIFFIAGLGQGTVARVVQQQVQRVINFVRQNQIEGQLSRRWYIFWLWQRIKAGAFDYVQGGVPKDWFLHEMNYPADLSVDLGREGKLYDDRVMRGNMSPRDYHAKQGRHYSDVDDELLDIEFERRKKLADRNKKEGLDIKYEQIWKLPPGTANVAAQVEAGDPADPADAGNEPAPEPAAPAAQPKKK